MNPVIEQTITFPKSTLRLITSFFSESSGDYILKFPESSKAAWKLEYVLTRAAEEEGFGLGIV